MQEVLRAYALVILLVAIVFVVAFFIGKSIRGGRLAGLVGLILIAIALLEKAGWTTRRWAPGSPQPPSMICCFGSSFWSALDCS